MDLEKFFDRVNHDVRMARVARQGRDRGGDHFGTKIKGGQKVAKARGV